MTQKSGTSPHDLALRRDALTTRAALQRIELATSLQRARQRSMTPVGAAGLALRLARSFAGSQAKEAASHARPLLLSAGWMLVKALRVSPTARWIAGAVAVGGAVWWVARALREGEPSGSDPETGDADWDADSEGG